MPQEDFAIAPGGGWASGHGHPSGAGTDSLGEEGTLWRFGEDGADDPDASLGRTLLAIFGTPAYETSFLQGWRLGVAGRDFVMG